MQTNPHETRLSIFCDSAKPLIITFNVDILSSFFWQYVCMLTKNVKKDNGHGKYTFAKVW